ncbi:hypothetical protein [Bartonella sp. B39]
MAVLLIDAGNAIGGAFSLYTGDLGAAHSVGASVEKNFSNWKKQLSSAIKRCIV